MGITPAHQKTEEDRIIWIWDDEFFKKRKEFKQTDTPPSN